MSRFLSLLALWFPLLATAQSGFHPQTTTELLFVAGSAYELVLRNGSYANPVSQLAWPIPPSVAAELTTKLPWTSWTATTFALQGLAPVLPGTMIDEDWNTGLLEYGRSVQVALLTAHWTARLEQEVSLGPLSFMAGGLYRWTSWDGWGGTGSYLYSSSTVPVEVQFSGLLISYRQLWLIPYLGASWNLNFTGLQLTPSLRLGPWSWCFDADNHFYPTDRRNGASQQLATITFLDSTRGGVYVQGGLEALFPTDNSWAWGFRSACEVNYGTVGDTWVTNSIMDTPGTTHNFLPETNVAGSWYYEASISIFLKS
jgi:outer membrane protease